jgi:TorA maturation chaperone TorD
MDSHNSFATLEALRDFFMAQNAAGLAAAYDRLVTSAPEAAPAVPDWPSVEFAFNRLFVGPKALLAPPFASVYLEPEPQLMGRSTLNVRYLYQMMGLTSPWQNSLPDDHLGLELDAYYQLQTVLSQINSTELKALQEYFLIGHLNRWLPQFISRVKAAPEIPAPIIFLVDQLNAWLQAEVSNLKVTKVPA